MWSYYDLRYTCVFLPIYSAHVYFVHGCMSRAAEPSWHSITSGLLSTCTCIYLLRDPDADMAASSNDKVTENLRRGMPGAPQSVIDDLAGEIKQLHEAMRSGAISQQEFDQKADAGVRKIERIAQDYRPRNPTDVESLRAQLAALQTSNEGDQPWSFHGQCFECGRAAEKLSRCSKCKVAKYCSAACQRTAWARHKYSCGTALPTAVTVREATAVRLLAMLREFGSFTDVLHAVSRTIMTTSTKDRMLLVRGEAPFLLVQALRINVQSGRGEHASLWGSVLKAVSMFFVVGADGQPNRWTQDAAQQLAESDLLAAIVLQVLQLGSIGGDVFERWRRTEYQGAARLAADELHYAVVSFLGIVLVAEPPAGLAIRQRAFDVGAVPILRGALDPRDYPADLSPPPTHVAVFAAKALHALLCHEESNPRLLRLLQRTQLPDANPDASQEGFILVQAISFAGERHPANLEMLSYLRDLAVVFVATCSKHLPGMLPSTLLVYKTMREAVRKAMAAECVALFETFESLNPDFARVVDAFLLAPA